MQILLCDKTDQILVDKDSSLQGRDIFKDLFDYYGDLKKTPQPQSDSQILNLTFDKSQVLDIKTRNSHYMSQD